MWRALLLLAACGSPPKPHTLQQHEITQPGALLTSDGKLREPGWARQQLLEWDPSLVHDPAKLREWDFFTVENAQAAVNLTITDLGFAKLASVGVVDFASGKTFSSSLFASGGDTFILSQAAFGEAQLTAQGAATPALAFTGGKNGDLLVTIAIPSSLLGDAAQGSITIHRTPALQYLSLATPFAGDAHEFFFEQKVPSLTADGSVTIGTQSWTFSSAGSVMDWGRGEWPSQVTWRWAGANGTVDGGAFAFNLGEGFGDDTFGTENLLVRGEVAQKLGEIAWTHDANDPMQDWTFAADGVALTLHPTAIETGGLDFGAKYEHLKKAYGQFSGTLTLDDGSTATVDGLLGFAEEMNLAW